MLRALYPSVDEIDLFVAAVAEKPLPGALLGQTLVCLVGDQFARLRRGDRFYYEEGGQPSSFSPRKYIHTRRFSLYSVLCILCFTTVTTIQFQHLQDIFIPIIH
jgi:peroxidase